MDRETAAILATARMLIADPGTAPTDDAVHWRARARQLLDGRCPWIFDPLRRHVALSDDDVAPDPASAMTAND